jgi:primosomal protein N' (replication factor Y)
MFAQVLLLNGFEKPLWYKIPERLIGAVVVGTVVRVPLQMRKESAMVTVLAATVSESFVIKELADIESFPHDAQYQGFIEKISQFYFVRPIHFYQRIRHFLKEEHADDHASAVVDVDHTTIHSVQLTHEQQVIVDYVNPYIVSPSYVPTLIHGVTGSGKTEVYKRLIQTAIEQGKTVVLLLPEVTLALQFEHLLRNQLSGVQVIGFHSASKVSEKKHLWDCLVHGTPLLIVGVHLPIMLPIANLGLIIVDEEHEHGFQEKKHPKMNSKDVALWRASYCKIPIVLGSATPSLNSLYNAQRHGWRQFTITKRFAGKFPVVEKVILTERGQRRRKVFWVSPALETAVRECLANKKQAIIFLNRRGYSFFVQCKSCGFTFQCPHCSVSLTLHQPNDLRCHYCDYVEQLPHACPQCKAPEKELMKKGIGTQQLVQIFKELFPHAVIERADLDSTSKKRSWQKTVEQFTAGEINILIGTQTITKGYHFPNVTLVGVLWADLNLHFPLYNAGETTLQQLIQVAGRAGRQCENGKVIVQVMQDHPIFDYLDEQKYMDFCATELEMRQESFYPPYARLVHVELKHKNPIQIDKDAQLLAVAMRDYVDKQQLDVSVLGPAFPLISRVQNTEIRHIVLKSAAFGAIHALLREVEKVSVESSVFVVMNS